MNTLSRVFVIAALTVYSLPNLYADGVEDYYLQRYNSTAFDLPQNAPSFGMAGSTMATLGDSSAILSNPAGLGWMKVAEISGAYSYERVTGNDINTFEDVEAKTHAGHAIGAFSLGPRKDSTPDYGTIGGGWSKIKSNGDDSGDLDLDGYRLHLAYGKEINNEMAVGYSASYHYTQLFSNGSRELRMDDGIRQTLGIQYKVDPDTMAGLSTAFGFGKYESKRDGDDSNFNLHSLNIAGGISHMLAEDLLGAIGVDYTSYALELGPDTYVWNGRIGVEKAFGQFRARLGYRYVGIFGRDTLLEGGSTKNDKINAGTAGVGYYFENGAHVDYGVEYRQSGDGDWTHLVSAAFPFSMCEDV